MADEAAAPRSRRALLTAAAGAAGALAASAALPLSAAAIDPNDVVKGVDNPTTATTSVTNATADSTSFAGNAIGLGHGVVGTSTGEAGVFAWSVSAPLFAPGDTAFTGVFGYAPADPVNALGTGVWGDSLDTGVYGTGSLGVLGYGGIGVEGDAFDIGGIGVYAYGDPAQGQTALYVDGKVTFRRSGRATVGSGKSNIKVTLAGVNSGSRIFAMLHSNRTGRWVQSVVPVTGSFTIYLNGTVSSATYVAWFSLN